MNTLLTKDVDLEERPGNLLNISTSREPRYWNLIDRYSSLIRLLRITALCQRAANCLKKKAIILSNPISSQEIQLSCQFLVRIVQKAWFYQEMKEIAAENPLPNSSSLTLLTPFIDEGGLLVGGRLQHAQLDSDSKHPLILPRQSPLTRLVLADAHLKTFHGGTQSTLEYIRRSY